MNLSERIQILKDAGQICEETKSGILKVIDMFDIVFSIKLTEENGAMLITHLCMAVERIKKGGIVDNMDNAIFEEIKSNVHFDTAIKAIYKIERELDMSIPEIEQQFILMHLCVLFENEIYR